MQFNPGIDVALDPVQLGFIYGAGVAGPIPEYRRLDAIRASLKDSMCSGPDPVYAIAMDVAREVDLPELKSRMLLFGVVAYASGQLGDEPVRSQGHVHAVAPHSGWSPPEWFEIWEGTAIVYAQESTSNEPGACIAVTARPGDQVVVPPGWAHCVINADPHRRMVFGALCDRQYGFTYDGVRQHHGLAWFPLLRKDDTIFWERNPHYNASPLTERCARHYPELGCLPGMPMYQQFIADPDSVQWVSEPHKFQQFWTSFQP